MATQANLIATYNANPTLQSRYTLQEYLDLFGFGATTTPTPDPDPTPTPTPEVPGIPNIINQNLNQGGGGDSGPQGIASVPGTYQKEVIGVMPDGSPMFSGYKKTEGIGVIDSLKNTADNLFELYQKYSPFGMIGAAIKKNKAFKTAQTNKALEQIEMQRKIREAEALAAQIGPGLASLTTQGGGGGIASSGMTGAQAAGMGGGSQQATSAGSTKSGRTDGGWGWAKGGFVRGSYFNGGIVSLRRR